MRLFSFLRNQLKEFSNFPKEYIQRSKQQVSTSNFNLIQFNHILEKTKEKQMSLFFTTI